jgi:hypothetical protein
MEDISVVFDPEVELAPIKIRDDEYGSGGNEVINKDKESKKIGLASPYVLINGMTFYGEGIEYLEIKNEGFLPKMTLIVKDKSDFFLSKYYPMDREIASVLIRSNNSDFKDIRVDFVILSIFAEENFGHDALYTIDAIMDVPGLSVDKIKSYSSKSSLDVLKDIAKEIKLGFSSNVSSTTDSMSWLCPNTDYLDFILNDVLPGSYNNDDSFFDCFIDWHYFMNFVEVNSLLKREHNLEKISSTLNRRDYERGDESNEPELDLFYLSNTSYSAGSPNEIKKFTALNRAGEISLANGYRNYLGYYDKNKKEFKDVFVETLNDPNTDENEIILKGREGEDFRKQIRYSYWNDYFSENVHENFYFSKIQNKMNSDELEKINLSIILPFLNTTLNRYKIIPVLITSLDQRTKDLEKEDDKKDGYTINRRLSGNYVAKSLYHIYDKATLNFYTKVILTKREFRKIETNS